MNSTVLDLPVTAEHRLTPAELEQAHLFLTQTRTGLLGALKGVSVPQWTFKPAPEQWSIALIVEHIVFVFGRVLGPIRDNLANAPAPPAGHDFKLVDSIVINQFPNRLTKFPAPEFALPSGRFESPSDALGLVTQSYAALAEYLERTPDLRTHALEAPPLKAVTNGAHECMDGYQWMLAAAAHAERHTKQILEVKENGNFPAN